MEEVEVPIEGVQEEIHHHATHEAGQGSPHESAPQGWFSYVALSSALLAGLAAVSALLSGHHANDAMLEQLRSSDHWSYYQAKSIKSSVLSTRIAILQAMGHPASEADQEKVKQYEEDQKEISTEAKKTEEDSRKHFTTHEVFARAVTFFQIAIAIGAISVLTRRKRFFWVSLGAGVVGLGFLVQGLAS
jgi:hypothetical protein